MERKPRSSWSSCDGDVEGSGQVVYKVGIRAASVGPSTGTGTGSGESPALVAPSQAEPLEIVLGVPQLEHHTAELDPVELVALRVPGLQPKHQHPAQKVPECVLVEPPVGLGWFPVVSRFLDRKCPRRTCKSQFPVVLGDSPNRREGLVLDALKRRVTEGILREGVFLRRCAEGRCRTTSRLRMALYRRRWALCLRTPPPPTLASPSTPRFFFPAPPPTRSSVVVSLLFVHIFPPLSLVPTHCSFVLSSGLMCYRSLRVLF